jgi:hypothetical protein
MINHLDISIFFKKLFFFTASPPLAAFFASSIFFLLANKKNLWVNSSELTHIAKLGGHVPAIKIFIHFFLNKV